jgi:hypothetical protein
VTGNRRFSTGNWGGSFLPGFLIALNLLQEKDDGIFGRLQFAGAGDACHPALAAIVHVKTIVVIQ